MTSFTPVNWRRVLARCSIDFTEEFPRGTAVAKLEDSSAFWFHATWRTFIDMINPIVHAKKRPAEFFCDNSVAEELFFLIYTEGLTTLTTVQKQALLVQLSMEFEET